MVISIDVSRANTIQRTGVEQYTWHLIDALKGIIKDATVVLYSPTPPIPEWGKFPPSWQWRSLGWMGKRGWTQLRLSSDLAVDPSDVFFAPCSALPAFVPARTIATVHDVSFLTFPHLYSSVERVLQRSFLSRIVTRADAIITPTHSTERSLIERYPQCQRRVVVIPHGAKQLSLPSPTQKKPYSLLFVGRIELKKNIPALIEAVELLAHQEGYPAITLELVGAPGYGHSTIQPFLHQCSTHIHHHGWLSEDQLEGLRQNSLITVLPSFEEGFGFPIVEAWASRSIPVISPCPALQEVGGDAVIASSDWSARSIADAIRRIFDHPQRIAQWQEQGTAALSRLSWIECARTTFSVLCGDVRL